MLSREDEKAVVSSCVGGYFVRISVLDTLIMKSLKFQKNAINLLTKTEMDLRCSVDEMKKPLFHYAFISSCVGELFCSYFSTVYSDYEVLVARAFPGLPELSRVCSSFPGFA